jgi:hypothetical protein
MISDEDTKVAKLALEIEASVSPCLRCGRKGPHKVKYLSVSTPGLVRLQCSHCGVSFTYLSKKEYLGSLKGLKD